MPEIVMARTLDWHGYDEHEVPFRRFVPGEEPFEQDRVRFVSRLLGSLRPKRVLDVGCGGGYLCKRYWERRSLLRFLGDRGRAFLGGLLVAAGVVGIPRAKYIGVLCRKAHA